MGYTNRTCHYCGFRNAQPKMKQVEIQYTSGSSEKTMSVGSIIGAFLDDPRAQKQNAEALLGVSKRKYKRRRKVWVCANGCRNHQSANNGSSAGRAVEQYQAPTNQQSLERALAHYEEMFGVLVLWIKDYEKLKTDVADKKKLSSAEANRFESELRKIAFEIERQTVHLGDVYKSTSPRDFETLGGTFKRLFFKFSNIAMWIWGITVILLLFF